MSKIAEPKVLEVTGLSFSYSVGDRTIEVLKGLDFAVERGEYIAIQGPSGSGKSTLFYLLGLLLRPTHGTVKVDGRDVTQLSSDELAWVRNQRIGFVFQQFHLLARTSALNNILLPAHYPAETARPTKDKRAKALSLAKLLGLTEHLSHAPNQLSGGQQQRVAIARALLNNVDLILADEPTGNLDSQNALQILELLDELNSQGKTIVMITHDSEVAQHCGKVYHLRDGAFTSIETTTRKKTASATPKSKSKNENESEIAIPALDSASPATYRRLIASAFPLVLENLLRNKAKSLLTMLGVVIGIAAVLAMVTLGQFTKRKILEGYETMGVNKVGLRGYPNWQMKATDKVAVSFQSFNWDTDIVPLTRIFEEVNLISPVMSHWRNSASAGGLSVSEKVDVMGVTPEYMAITNRAFKLGRNLTPFHIKNRSPVCVIGFEIAERLFQRSNPLGQLLSITAGDRTSYPCRVIGVLTSQTSNNERWPPNLNILLPYTYFQTVTEGWWSGQIHELVIQLRSGADTEVGSKKIKAYFQAKYGRSGQFFVDSDSTLIAQMKRFLNLFAVMLTGIALLSLAVGGIGINNMMLVSVTERIKEFGLRKALGATDRSIRTQVLMESLVLCAVAGVVGAIIGFASYELLIFGATKFVPNLHFEWTIDATALLLSVISIVAVGIASGLVPALRAERLQVIEALRAE